MQSNRNLLNSSNIALPQGAFDSEIKEPPISDWRTLLSELHHSVVAKSRSTKHLQVLASYPPPSRWGPLTEMWLSRLNRFFAVSSSFLSIKTVEFTEECRLEAHFNLSVLVMNGFPLPNIEPYFFDVNSVSSIFKS